MSSASDAPILVLNSGSSSLKFGLYQRSAEEERGVLQGSAGGIGRPDGALHLRDGSGQTIVAREHLCESQSEALSAIAAVLRQRGLIPSVVGHRIVHGGPHLLEHQRITPEVVEQLRAATHLAPLHIPEALTLLAEAQRIFPHAEHIACFDTVFHRTMPREARQLPLPRALFDQGVQRYGFHGLSYESLVYRLGANLPACAIFAHLGNGSSLAAVRDGMSIDTSMGLTPTGGVLMGTRSGDLDPGEVLYLLRQPGATIDSVEYLLNHASGLAGYSGGESDMRALLARATTGEAAAALAVRAFTTAVRMEIGAYAALLGGVDLLVFTGGIGAGSAEIRAAICADLDFLGLGPGSDRVRVLPAEEEAQMARICRGILG